MRTQTCSVMASTPASEQIAHLERAMALAGLDPVEPVLPDEREAALGGIRLHWVDWGTAGWPPVVFLHGGCLTARTWDLVCLALRRDHHCLAADARGHGDSEWSPALDYGIETLAGDLERLVEHLGLERPVAVGQSLGGMTALAYAHRQPAAVAGLVLVDVVTEVQRAGTDRIADFVAGPAELDSIDAFVERARAFNPARDPRLLRRSLLHNLRPLPDGRWTWKYDPRAATPERLEALHADLRDLSEKLDAVTCPTLVVRGGESDVVTPEAAEAFAQALPQGRVATVPDAGHTVQGDNPRGLIEALRPFLAERTGTYPVV
jgi:pimeloyl-ACP methyl ester carboxylesterase